MNILPCASLVIILLALILLQQTSSAHNNHSPCPPSSCGKIHNITHPFRLKGDPSDCGLDEYELDCVNSVTVMNLSSTIYHVQDINYKRFEIRLIDAGVVEDTACSIPRYYLNKDNFSQSIFSDPPENVFVYGSTLASTVVFLNCTNSVTSDHRYIHVNGSSCDSGDHIYAFLTDHHSEFTMGDIKVGCRLKVATLANWTYDVRRRKVSYDDIRRWLDQGFWLSWLTGVTCDNLCGHESDYRSCSFNETTKQGQCVEPQLDQCYMFDATPIKCGKN